MRILIYAHSFPPSKGGLQYSNYEMVKGLYRLGHDIRLITCFNKGIEDVVSNFSFSVKILPKWNFTTVYSLSRSGLLNWLLAPLYFFIILKEIDNFKPDIGFITDETANAFWGVICRLVKIPYISYCSVPVFNRHERYSNCKFLQLILQTVIGKIRNRILDSHKRSNAIIVVSKSTKKQIVRKLPEIKNKVDIIPRSVDDFFFERQLNKEQIKIKKNQFHINENHMVFLSVSRLMPDKGIDDVIKAINNLENNKKQRVKYIVIGSGRYIDYLKKITTKFGLKNNVILHSEVEHLNLITFYDMCDIFVLPSKRGISESFGRVFVEAAARSKASIAVNEGGMKDIIENNKTGFLIEPGDINALQKIIEYALENKEQIQKMGLSAKAKAEKQYNCFINAKKIEKHLNEILYKNT